DADCGEKHNQNHRHQHHHHERDRSMELHDSVSLPIVGKAEVLRLASVTSTQDVARSLPIGSIVLADHQTAGRGRLDRRWEAPEGAAMLDQPRDDVFDRLRQKIATWTLARPDQVLARWRDLSATLGRRVRVDVSGAITEGLAEDIGPRGELIVDGVAFVAASVT